MNSEKILQAFIDIDNATEISCATLSIISESSENERLSWALIGIIGQIEKIRDSAKLIDESIQKKGGTHDRKQ